jgi:WD40 repeat protein
MGRDGTIGCCLAILAATLAVVGCRAGVHAGNDGGSGGLGGPDGAAGAGFDGPTIDGLGGFDGGSPVQLTACGYYGLGQVGAAAVSRDGKLLAIAALDFVAIVDVATKTIRHKLPAPGNPIAFALSPDGEYVGVGGWSGYYRVWRIADETMIANVPTLIQQMAFSPDGHQLMVIANGTGILSTYQFPSLTPQWTAPNTAGAAYAPDGSFIASASGPMFDPATGAKLGSLGDVPDVYYGLGVDVSSAGVVILSDDNHGVLELWRASDRRLIGTIATGRSVGGGAFSPDGKRLVGFDSSTKAVKVWSVPDGAVLGQYPLDAIHRGIAAVSFSASGAVIAAISDPPSVRLIDIDAGGKDLLTYAWGHSDLVWHAEVSPDGKLIATATGTDMEVDIWDLATSELITTLSEPNGAWDLRFSPDGRNLYVAGKTIDEWRVSDWTLTRQTAEGRGGVSGVAVSPDGTLLATGAHYDEIKIWRRADMTPLVTIPLSDNGGTPLAFSDDGALLGTFADAMHPAVYRVSDGTLLGKYPGGIEFWSSTSDRIAFTPDGSELLVIGEGLDELSVPDLGLRGELANSDTLYTFALAPAGKQLVISNLEHGIQLWDLPTRKLTGIGLFDGIALRSLALSFVPGDVKRIVTSNLDAVRLYCRPAQDTWIVE